MLVIFVKYSVCTFIVAYIFRRFEQLRKAAISLVMSVRPSVRPSSRTEQLAPPPGTDFHEVCYLNILGGNKSRKSKFDLNLTKSNGYFT